jgi:hypothetical protein
MFRWFKRPPPATDPSTIRHYRLTRKLGEGGLRVVYAGGERLLGVAGAS